ncbi:MAG: type II secretion system protein GspM [Pseudomonadota bacterium]
MNLTAIREAADAFWAAREPRERWLLGVGGGLLLLTLIYLGLWRPMADSRAELEAEVASRQDLVAWLRSSAAEARALREARGGAVPSGPLNDRVESAAEEAGLRDALSRLSAEGDGRIRAELDDATFRRTMIWLQGLERRQSIRPVRVRLERADEPGRVDGRLILEER